MTVPVARAEFDFSLSDLVDANLRWMRHRPVVRRQRLRQAAIAFALCAALLYILVMAWPPVPRAAYAAACGSAAAALTWWRWTGRMRRALRRMLGERYGEGPHHCAVELYEDRATVHQFGATTNATWETLTSVREEGRDVELRFHRTLAFVPGRAFADDAARAEFLAVVRRHAAAQGVATSGVSG